MGNKESVPVFTEDELRVYRDLTVFSKNEIRHVYQKFQALGTEDKPVTRDSKIPREDLYRLKELRINPFKDRMVTVFSSSKDGSMTFEDFLDMMSVFSEKSTKQIKTEYVFRIYDFDEDGFLGWEDIRKVIMLLTGEEKLNETDMYQLIEAICNEGDVDDDGTVSYFEFENMIDNCPDIVRNFRFRL